MNIVHIYIYTVYTYLDHKQNGTKQHYVLVVNPYPLVDDGTSIGIGMLI